MYICINAVLTHDLFSTEQRTRNKKGEKVHLREKSLAGPVGVSRGFVSRVFLKSMDGHDALFRHAEAQQVQREEEDAEDQACPASAGDLLRLNVMHFAGLRSAMVCFRWHVAERGAVRDRHARHCWYGRSRGLDLDLTASR